MMFDVGVHIQAKDSANTFHAVLYYHVDSRHNASFLNLLIPSMGVLSAYGRRAERVDLCSLDSCSAISAKNAKTEHYFYGIHL